VTFSSVLLKQLSVKVPGGQAYCLCFFLVGLALSTDYFFKETLNDSKI